MATWVHKVDAITMWTVGYVVPLIVEDFLESAEIAVMADPVTAGKICPRLR